MTDDEEARSICLGCGLCCDGTFFGFVPLGDGDDPEVLTQVGLRIRSKEDRAGFAQPCVASCDGSCAIYENRPKACRGYRCLLLIRQEQGDITRADAAVVIATTMELRDKVRAGLDRVLPTDQPRAVNEGCEQLTELLRASDGASSPDVSAVLLEIMALRASLPKQFDVELDGVAGLMQFVLAGEDEIPTVSAGVRSAVIGADLLVYDEEFHASHVLNESAACVWAAIDGVSSVGLIVDQVGRSAGLDRSVVANDVRRMITNLRESGLIDRVMIVDVPETMSEMSSRASKAARHRGAILERVLWVDPLGPRWAAGAPLEIRTNDVELATRLAYVASSLPVAVGPAPTISVLNRGDGRLTPFFIYVDDQLSARAESRDVAEKLVLMELNRRATDSPERLLFRAGAVELGGSAIMIAGDRGHGKSTLTAALVQHGFGYLADEVVSVDPTSRRIDPFPKALSLDDSAMGLLARPRLAAGDDLHPRMVAPSEFGSISTGGVLSLVVLLDDRVEPFAPDVRPIDNLLDLLRNTFGSTFRLPAALDELAAVCVDTSVLRLPRMPLDEAIGVIVEAWRTTRVGAASDER